LKLKFVFSHPYQHRIALGIPGTDAAYTYPPTPSPQFICQGHDDSRTGRTDGMAVGNGSPVYVHPSVHIFFTHTENTPAAHQRNRSEGLIDFDEINLI
jgi:hypothetical protein